jgi:signal transduction histidine kinase
MGLARWGDPKLDPDSVRPAARRPARPPDPPGGPGTIRVLVVAPQDTGARLMAALTRDGPAPGPGSEAAPWDGAASREVMDDLAAALVRGPWDVVLLAPGTDAAPRVMDLVGAHDPALPVVVAGAAGERGAARLLAAGARDALVGQSLARLGAVVAREVSVARLKRDWARVRDAEARLAQVRRRQGPAVAAAREAERRRLARELHDELGQSLTAIRLEAGALARHARDGKAAEAAARIERIAARVTALFRARLGDLDPPDLAPYGLVAALRARVTAWEREAGVPCTLSVFGPVGGLDGPVKLAAFRVVQEALTNAVRHARASRVRVRVGRLPGTLGRDDLLEVTVADDGVGPGHSDVVEGHGLTGLRARVAALDGDLTVTGGPQRGTRVTARLPVRTPGGGET